MKLYNTETREKQLVSKKRGETITLYTCGPTVYNFAHIGNFRTYVFEDLLRRSFKFFGWNVFQVMNLTDVDDKTIRGAIEKRQTLHEFTSVYIQAFFEDLATLGIEKAESYPPATEYIPEMIEMIQTLLDKDLAYIGTDQSVYFKISAFPKYGRLSHLACCDLQSGIRISSDEYDKEQICDFVLWKAYDEKRDGNIFWESPFGNGRPGWHIECSAMATKMLGDQIDFHVGGVDNMFPHHENEIAQSEGVSGKVFVSHWLHAEHLLVDHKKMSKSLGNFYTVRDLLAKGYSGVQIRYALLQAHYRTQLNFSLESLHAAGVAVERLIGFKDRLQYVQNSNLESQDRSALQVMQTCVEKFSAFLADDLNISASLAVLFETVREIHGLIDEEKVGSESAGIVLKELFFLDRVLGIFSFKEEQVPDHLLELLAKRNEARSLKQWNLADEYRDVIIASGYKIEDSPSGAILKKIRNL